jgi:hypothetical protein
MASPPAPSTRLTHAQADRPPKLMLTLTLRSRAQRADSTCSPLPRGNC